MKTETQPLLIHPPTDIILIQNYQTESTNNLRERRKSPTNTTSTMHHPQHHFHHQQQNDDERGGNGNGGGGGGVNGNTSIARPAVATRSSSRQTFYNNRIPTSHGSLQHHQHHQQQQQYNHPQQSDVVVGSNNNGGIGIGQPSSSTLDHSYNSRHTNMTTNMRNSSSAVNNVATATARTMNMNIAANTTTTTMVSSSSDELSTDSSLDELHMPYSNTPMGGGEGRGSGNNTGSGSGLTGGGGGMHEHQPHHQRQGGLPPPKQLHADYSHRLHKNQVAQGHHNFVVGGAHGRYRDYGGTLIEVPEEVYAVRKAALTVLDPITYCWLILTIGFSISAVLGALKWTSKLSSLPYWLIFTPAWTSHVGIVLMHIASARALSKFISEANETRQRQESTDHLDRVEYLPLLQRSLKFGLKTGVLCFILFIFEILLYVRLNDPGSISLAETYIPLWIVTIVFIGNGIVCKSQHFVHSLIWMFGFTAMLLSVLRIDLGLYDTIQTSHIIMVILGMLGLISGTLIYIVHGHQIGYYKLTESQLTAGVFYSTSSFLAILLVAIMGDAVALPELIQLDLLLVIVILAPIVVALAGFGAYLVTRDEFDRLLKYGGQSAVMPMRLRLETDGWTSVVSRGAVTIPMFGDVRYEPLDVETAERLSIELCGPCCCYPAVEEDEIPYYHRSDNYQSPTPPNSMAATARWGGSEAPIV